jgi:hypothetical protein
MVCAGVVLPAPRACSGASPVIPPGAALLVGMLTYSQKAAHVELSNMSGGNCMLCQHW